jgi:hypothetical protein
MEKTILLVLLATGIPKEPQSLERCIYAPKFPRHASVASIWRWTKVPLASNETQCSITKRDLILTDYLFISPFAPETTPLSPEWPLRGAWG